MNTTGYYDDLAANLQQAFNKHYFDALVVVIAATAFICYNLFTYVAKGLKLPPGPPRSLIFGNMYDIPVAEEWKTYTKWTKKFGDIVYLRVFGTKMLLLGSYQVAHELLDKRSAIYSDRPIIPPMMDLAGFSNSVTVMGNNADYRVRRRLFEQHFRYSFVHNHQPVQIRETHKLLRKYLKSPDTFLDDTKHTIGAIILDIVYGYRVTSDRDPWVETGERLGATFVKLIQPGVWAVNALPVLRYAPTWFPFTEWKVFALTCAAHLKNQVHGQFNMVKTAMREGTANPSMVLRYLEENENGADIPEKAIMEMASDAYGAGVETTLTLVHGFLLQMTKNRDVQRKAQEELDRVCPDRLPIFDDRKKLPYIEAIGMEVGRWHPGAPQGIPHRLEKDDSFEGKFLPKGSIIVPNIWAMCHDEEIYKYPDVFDPDRFMKGDSIDTSVRDPRQMIFGFGRRQCPGRPLAEAQFFYTMASVLKAFDILPPLDTEGREVVPPDVYRSGIVSLPLPFSCRIIPRSSEMAELVRQTE
ncbi:cytochrome P450 [Gymnopus androsaceus JB14]|uniref:Cytochrome P450 n=1 Tax=Gymnopus androsaceus JB14 TaxID=1447944 RepID=A0A6A4HKW1_9AGAR|nr:cytochrome P450 [Gymnopus androsaceus JB14]